MNNNDTITETAYINSDGKIEVNLSSIFTRLIQEAGRWCESYASDILVDIDSVKNCLKLNVEEWKDDRHYETDENGNDMLHFAFGFRQSGVDHKEWIIENQKSEQRKYHYYRAIWDLEITNDRKNHVTFKLKRR